MTSEVVFHTEWLTDLERRVKALEAAVRPAPEPAPVLYDGVVQVKSTMYGPEFECRIPQLKAGMKVHLTVRLPDA